MSSDSDSDGSGSRLRLRSGAASDSDDERNTGGVLAAGVLLGLFAAEHVRAIATRQPVRRRRQRRRAPLPVRDLSDEFSDIDSTPASDGSSPAVGNLERRAASQLSPRRASNDPRKGAVDGWSEVTLEEFGEWRDEGVDAGDAVSSNGWIRNEGRRDFSMSYDSVEKVANRVYSRTRVDGTCLVNEEPRRKSINDNNGKQGKQDRKERSSRRGKPKLRKRRKVYVQQEEQGRWGSSIVSISANPPSRILRWSSRAMRSGGLADLCN